MLMKDPKLENSYAQMRGYKEILKEAYKNVHNPIYLHNLLIRLLEKNRKDHNIDMTVTEAVIRLKSRLDVNSWFQWQIDGKDLKAIETVLRALGVKVNESGRSNK